MGRGPGVSEMKYDPRFRRTKIVATVGPASRDESTLEAMISAGVNVLRVNSSHGTAEPRAELMERIESTRGPVGPLNKFQIEEMIDPRDTRRWVCEWVENAYKVVSQPARLVPRTLQFRP